MISKPKNPIKAKTETHPLDDIPVILRRKYGRTVWSARITLDFPSGRAFVKGSDGNRVDRGTGEKDLSKAITKAHEIYADLKIRIQRGESINPKNFDTVVAEYLSDLERDLSDGLIIKDRLTSARTTLERYYTPYFLQEKIDTITSSDLLRHQKWRERYHIDFSDDDTISYVRNGKVIERPFKPKKPTVAYIRKEHQQFNYLMNFAVLNGYIRAEAVPKYAPTKGDGNIRDAFDQDEISQLQKYSADRIRKGKHKQHRRQWVQNHYRFLFIYLTGCRPQEIAKLKFSDLDEGSEKKGELLLVALKKHHLKNSKVRKHLRRVVPQHGFKELILNLKELYVEFDNHIVVDDDYIFHNPDGSLVRKTAKTFKKLLKEAHLDNGARTLYSLRHTFITERLYEKQDVDFICRWTGTSWRMIDTTYSHVRVEIEHQKPREENTVTLEPFSLPYLLGEKDAPEKTQELNMFEAARKSSSEKAARDKIQYVFFEKLAKEIIADYEDDLSDIDDAEAEELTKEKIKDIAGLSWKDAEIITNKVMVLAGNK